MEAVEEVVAAPPCHNNINDLPVAKGKRTKRQRPDSPTPFTVNNHRLSPGFSTASADESTTTAEEDTARCLILLARGHFLISDHDSKQNNYSSKRPAEAAAAAAADKGGGAACMYACKTCNRVFSSFQALGGHRTSHKKPKNEKKSSLFYDIDEDFPSPSKKRLPPHSLSLQLSSTSAAGKQFPSPRIHECSYCGAEFTSGQALGGHMRRHRGAPISPSPTPAAASIVEPEPEPKKQRNGLSLDLNFPAPEDENQKFEFDSRQQKRTEKLGLSASTPTLVDCHF